MTSIAKSKKKCMSSAYKKEKAEREWHKNFMNGWIKRDLWLTVKEIEDDK